MPRKSAKKATAKKSREEIMNETLWWDDFDDIEMWVRWVIVRPRVEVGARSNYIESVGESIKRANYHGISLNFKTCDDFRNYMKEHFDFKCADDIKDMKEYPIFIPVMEMVKGMWELTRRDRILWMGLRGIMLADVSEKHMDNFIGESARYWCWEQCDDIVKHCPFTVCGVITIG